MHNIGATIRRLESDVLNDNTPLASILRQVLILGGHISSKELRTWAESELQGYSDTMSDIPSYRKIPAQIKADTLSGMTQYTGQPISPQHLPEEARNQIKEEIYLPWGVGEIQATLQSPTRHIHLSMPGMAHLAGIMTAEQRRQGNPFFAVTSVYWVVSLASLQGVLDNVRTNLAKFFAELLATTPSSEGELTPEQVQAAAVSTIQITTGDNSPITLTAPFSYATHNSSASSMPALPDQKRNSK
ncbi:AbiTii domain-containing protein [Streptomyces evansiae]|uniref:AbiTii domain-containing protein n=1 Tax=Streptomyces evansiae TaxID=3075535 RepID=UPI0028853600|nr:hypothetical protein [Streptomyces sp. DSM 41859]MDT0422205.1 hypothetical protein [Streptomyces sp. DSM 41859]